MPELPEVETIRRGFEEYVMGKKVEKVEVRLPKIIYQGNVGDLVNRVVIRARRFGKVLVLDLSNGLSLLAHIKLTGQFVFRKAREVSKIGLLPNRWTRIIFYFTDGSKLFYNDIRQFGWMRIIPTNKVELFKFISELGPEPFSTLTLKKFGDILQNRSTKIKQVLLDQTKISGIGNIYANDALFLAGINPTRPAKSLGLREQSKLYEAILAVLKRGLKYGGASENTYVNILGEQGEYQNHFLAYGRAGKPCKKCRTLIKRISIGGRGTYYCTACQR
ncbi:MAG: DNA-formamidopyrimidine glycosylase [Candidatus Blackburnbacteria bacterium]|nr:DNA-formamidopyrimidine glycosylase [Candidatus Blackburnbacteria bacterium]